MVKSWWNPHRTPPGETSQLVDALWTSLAEAAVSYVAGKRFGGSPVQVKFAKLSCGFVCLLPHILLWAIHVLWFCQKHAAVWKAAMRKRAGFYSKSPLSCKTHYNRHGVFQFGALHHMWAWLWLERRGHSRRWPCAGRWSFEFWTMILCIFPRTFRENTWKRHAYFDGPYRIQRCRRPYVWRRLAANWQRA